MRSECMANHLGPYKRTQSWGSHTSCWNATVTLDGPIVDSASGVADTILTAIQTWQLKCNHAKPLNSPYPPLRLCSYPGANVFIAAQQFHQILCKRQNTEAKDSYKLANVTDAATVREWTETYLSPEVSRMEEMQHSAKAMVSRNSWPHKPLHDEL
ncbi:hexosaminidase D-like [Tropilaelaps mercedesae]|uniref:Hexosaminidase D-like n=1 Tax=Tropilaelaps mercedesae TaxID=418985 RepID=A0A1V9XV12_9ACAR|nr:hexosaminidase D-like [Tropilaelaps mercedesae]